MLKYYDFAIVFEEYPDETTLAIEISGCPCKCEQCSEPWLQKDVGTVLDTVTLTKLVEDNPDVTAVGFQGGDQDHAAIKKLSEFLHQKYPKLKVGMYSGLDSLDLDLLSTLDYYKIGRWVNPKGKVSEWWKKSCGPLQFPFSNQIMFKKINNNWVNITNKFRTAPISDLEKYIIK